MNIPPVKTRLFRYTRKTLLVLIAASLIVLVPSAILMAYAYRADIESENKVSVVYATIDATLRYKAIVKPALIYDYKTVISNEKIYYTLVKNIIMNITITPTLYDGTELGPVKDVSTSTRAAAVIKAETWAKRYNVSYTTYGGRERTVYRINIDVSDLAQVVGTIDYEINTRTRVYRYEISISYVITVTYSSGIKRTYMLNPRVTVVFDLDSNIVRIESSGMKNSYSKDLSLRYINTISGLGITVTEARRITLYTVLASATVFLSSLAIYGKWFRRSSETTRNIMSRHKSIIVRGRLAGEASKPIIDIDNPELLFALAKRYRKPVVYNRDNKRIYLVLDDAIYTSSVSAPG